MQIARMSSRGTGFARSAQARPQQSQPRRIPLGESINRAFIGRLAGFIPPVKRQTTHNPAPTEIVSPWGI